MNIKNLFIMSVLLGISLSAYADCNNLVKIPYINAPKTYAPQDSLGKGVKIWIKGKSVAIPDTRPQCLPIPLRYNNPGAMKTRQSGYWPGQISKDSKGHAVFATLEDGITAMGLWFKMKNDSGKRYSAFDIMSIYAPPNGCVGDIGTPPNNCKFGLNPTKEYATRVAKSVNKTYKDHLNLDGADCREGRESMYALVSEISTFEIGGNFCGKKIPNSLASCVIDREVFDKAMDKAFGPVHYGKCVDPSSAHEKD